MPRRRSNPADPFEDEIETALRPGQFIGSGYEDDFIAELEAVKRRIDVLIRADPERAIRLYELFLAASYQKADEVDDSDGMFGDFAGTLFCGWVRARQSAKKDNDETAELLLRRMDDDEYGFAYSIETTIADVFDKAGLAAFERAVLRRVEETDDRCWAGILRAIYVSQHAPVKYIELAERTGLSSADCQSIAKLLQSKRKLEASLSWVERGIAIWKTDRGGSSHELPELKRILLTRLGRGDEAEVDAWSEYRADPNRFSYETVMQYTPKGERSRRHDEAMEIAAQSSDLRSVIELWMSVREIDRVIDRLRASSDTQLQSLSHHVTEPVAKRLARKHPDIAARLYRAMGMRILSAKKSAYYYAALDHFANVRLCYMRASMQREWDLLVELIRRDHHRKSSFMPAFERVIRGQREPGFLDRARERWGR